MLLLVVPHSSMSVAMPYRWSLSSSDLYAYSDDSSDAAHETYAMLSSGINALNIGAQ